MNQSSEMKIQLSKYYNLILLIILIFSIVTISLLFENINENDQEIFLLPITRYKRTNYIEDLKRNKSPAKLKDIECITSNNKSITCVKRNSQIYLPFEYISKKFDIYGKEDEFGKFKISISNGQIFTPNKTYNSSGEYLWFHTVDVESRDRVKYINFQNGVPVSSQWNASGHIYPVQVGQFGLSHYSKWIKQINKTNKNYVHEFTVKDNMKFVHHDNENAIVKVTQFGFDFKFPEKAIYKMNYSFDVRYLMADIKTSTKFELIIDLMLRDFNITQGNYIVRLVYKIESISAESTIEQMKSFQNDDKTYQVVYTIKTKILKSSFKFIRNFCLDACKALKIKCENCLKTIDELTIKNKNITNRNMLTGLYYKVYQIALTGEGSIENATLRDQTEAPHYHIAKQAADYLISTQNKQTGGWAINVLRKFDKKSKVFLKPGWYSAMAQGHAISLLCRLFNQTKNENYLISASKALNIFDLDVNEGGVRSYLMNSVNNTWYEEYPTQPVGLFVLNGFIYSMFGLNDFIHSCAVSETNSFIQIYKTKAKLLYLNGLKSLVKNINLYDSGVRSFYDLRHLSDATVDPNTARWDYHSLHISQLLYLVNMVKNSQLINRSESDVKISKLLDVAHRWLDYTKGKWYRNSQISNQINVFKNLFKEN